MLAATREQIQWEQHHRRWQQQQYEFNLKKAKAEQDVVNARLAAEAKMQTDPTFVQSAQEAAREVIDRKSEPWKITLGGKEDTYKQTPGDASIKGPQKITGWDQFDRKEDKEPLTINVAEAESIALLSMPVTPTSTTPVSNTMNLEEDTVVGHFKKKQDHPAKRARTDYNSGSDSDSEFVKLSAKDFSDKEQKI